MVVVRAAQYLRMSTEHQNYSLEHQAAAIALYAAERGYDLVRTYADPGRSGLRLAGRDALKRLLADVVSPNPSFSIVLVYDVSRWGRFQDPDESAHYEFICRSAGVRVEYCGELFSNDGSTPASIMKHLKRIMAGEYSRELSAKVALAQRRLAELGYWQGGQPGYGLRRQTVDANGEPQVVLESGQGKAIFGHRVRIVLGPEHEVAIVRRIFRLYVVDGLSRVAIARLLNAEGVPAEDAARWSSHRVEHILSSEKYVGVLEFGATTTDLATGRVRRTAPGAVLRVPGAIEPIVSRRWFNAAKRNLSRRRHEQSKAAMLDGLRDLVAEHGFLTAELIDRAEHTPCAQTYRKRFGRLLAAYEAAGYKPDSRQIASAAVKRKDMVQRRRYLVKSFTDQELIDGLRAVLQSHGRLTVSIINEATEIPGAEHFRKRFGNMDRVYALAGYEPTARQSKAIANMAAQYAAGRRWTAAAADAAD